MAKEKTIEQLVKLYFKQQASWLANSNTTKPVKYWLDEYLNTLSKPELYSLVCKLLKHIYELDETIEE